MGHRTPNIDRMAKEGALFTDWYGEQSCTAGRALSSQDNRRSGRPYQSRSARRGHGTSRRRHDCRGSLEAARLCDRAIRKNHLGDRNEYLPTVHGFDEFFGNLYHLNAEEEPQNPDYPKDPKFGPVRAARAQMQSHRDRRCDRRSPYGRVGKQVIENTGPLDTKRMETVDEEFIGAAIDFIDRKHKANTPWFCYFNPTRMHVWTHLKPASDRQTCLRLRI